MKNFPAKYFHFVGKYAIIRIEKSERSRAGMSSNKKMRLVVASGNKNKLREIAEIFTEFEVVSQKEMGFDEEVEETGTTFA